MKEKMKNLAVLFWAFFKIGLFTFGGGMAMVPIIERVICDEKKWLSKDEMLDCIAVSQSMPGVIAVNAATYVGKRRGQLPGAVAATLGVIVPSFVIICLIVVFLGRLAGNPHMEGAMKGIKAAICGLIAVTCIRLGKQAFHGWFPWAMGIGAFILIVVFKVTVVWIIAGSAVLGILYKVWMKNRGESR